MPLKGNTMHELKNYLDFWERVKKRNEEIYKDDKLDLEIREKAKERIDMAREQITIGKRVMTKRYGES
jgi:hypothetical protein